MNKEIGLFGENLSEAFLIEKGYEILKRNYRTKFGEIDIIAKKGSCIVFVEVKTRRTETYGLPRESITSKKQFRLYKLAEHYIVHNQLQHCNYRFDVIEIKKDQEAYMIEHIKNAF